MRLSPSSSHEASGDRRAAKPVIVKTDLRQTCYLAIHSFERWLSVGLEKIFCGFFVHYISQIANLLPASYFGLVSVLIAAKGLFR
jgi:hypothetical protein